VEDLYSLEDYMKKTISENGGRDIKETLRTVKSLGEKSITTLINLLGQKNLRIEKNGKISRIS
jgi:predicted transcriptional regulator